MTTFVMLTPKTYIYGGLSPKDALCTFCACNIAGMGNMVLVDVLIYMFLESA